MSKIIELIYTEQTRGSGKEDDPLRLCPQLWTKGGLLVAEQDPMGRRGGTHDPSEDKDWFEEITFEPRQIDL